jgi:protein-tyrosine phosphatase
MIDIHSHILWGLDDGAQTLDDSIGMLRLAAEGGTTEIVATPHANNRYRYDEAIVAERIREVAGATAGLPKIHRGCEVHLTFDNLQETVARPSSYSINGGPYVLVEFPGASLRGMAQALQTLIDRGLIPIMAHPERQPELQRINSDFLGWIEMGCLAQITGQSLLGRFGKTAEESAWEMLRRGFAHFVASDAHGLRDRTPRLDEPFSAVVGRCGRETAESLFTRNPEAVVTGQRIQGGAPKKRPWYRL